MANKVVISSGVIVKTKLGRVDAGYEVKQHRVALGAMKSSSYEEEHHGGDKILILDL